MNYFDKLPTITYDGQLVKNLLARAKLSDRTKSNRMAFYPYTMNAVDRVDVLSDQYYDNPGYTWLIWFSNDVVDPYYDLALSEEDFYNYIVAKYGSFEVADRTIRHYAIDWAEDEQQITPAQYDALTAQHKKYYDPLIDSMMQVHSYRRKKEDSIVSTNMVMTLTLATKTGDFTVGEEVQVNSTNYAWVSSANSTAIVIQHINGNFANSSNITGKTSGATATVNVATVSATTIAFTDSPFWKPVSYFEYEHELNEQKKEIQLIDVRYRDSVESELKRVMNTK